MNPTPFAALGVTLLVVPLALALDLAPASDPACPLSGGGPHQYLPPANGLVIDDGHRAYYRGWGWWASPPASTAAPAAPEPSAPAEGACDVGPTVDLGHSSLAVGGAILPVYDGDGVTGGSLLCHGVPGHHGAYGPISVYDEVLGYGATFHVGVDTADLVGLGCGDGISDAGATCVGTCMLTFPPGADGAYWVFVEGTFGYVDG